MRVIPFKTIAILAAALPAAALDISGKVIDRHWRGIEGAKVCAAAGSPCAVSAADGSFRVQGPVGLGGAERLGSRGGYSLSAASGGLSLTAGSGGRVGLAWSSADGRLIGGESSLRTAPGGNRIPSPAGEGLLFLRLRAGGAGAAESAEIRWKVLFIGGAAAWVREEMPSGTALAKGAGPAPGMAAADLVADKAGFARGTWKAEAETGIGALILLPPPGDDVRLLFNGKDFEGWDMSAKAIGNAPGSWVMQDGAFHSQGTVRGTLSTKEDFGSFRILFSLRHLPSTGSDHAPCVVIWGTRPPPNDALGGIQFQPPNGGHWDYRPGKNNAGSGFSGVAHEKLNSSQWSQCEIWAKQSTGEARMACCALGSAATCKGVEVLKFKEAAAGKKGPLGLQIHNSGLHDEYRNISIEVDPKLDDLITTRL